MKWYLWPRQYGKTERLKRWFMEDPSNRVILCHNEQTARYHRRDLQDRLIADGHVPAAVRKTVKNNVMSHRSWKNGAERGRPKGVEIALDDMIVRDLIYREFEQYGAKVKRVAIVGRNEEHDDKAHTDHVDKMHEQHKGIYGPPGFDPGIGEVAD